MQTSKYIFVCLEHPIPLLTYVYHLCFGFLLLLQVLLARSMDDRARTYDHALEVTDKFNREANILLLRMFMLKTGLVHKVTT
jgi:hypothetical protein